MSSGVRLLLVQRELYGRLAAGADAQAGGEGKDNLRGDGGDDCLEGLLGDDKLNTKDGVPRNDRADGGPGQDVFTTDSKAEKARCLPPVR